MLMEVCFPTPNEGRTPNCNMWVDVMLGATYGEINTWNVSLITDMSNVI